MGRHGIAETLTGALVLAVALVFMAYAVAHSGRTTSEGYTLQARFDRIDGLTIGGDVRIAGVKIGFRRDRVDVQQPRPSIADRYGRGGQQ
jgi:phospholipid/cholesterol/gamma-HCH transport system substrate-binding protein